MVKEYFIMVKVEEPQLLTNISSITKWAEEQTGKSILNDIKSMVKEDNEYPFGEGD